MEHNLAETTQFMWPKALPKHSKRNDKNEGKKKKERGGYEVEGGRRIGKLAELAGNRKQEDAIKATFFIATLSLTLSFSVCLSLFLSLSSSSLFLSLPHCQCKRVQSAMRRLGRGHKKKPLIRLKANFFCVLCFFFSFSASHR